MIINRLLIYFLCFFIVYTPVRPARAFVPLVPVVVGLTGQAAMWTGRTLIARMAVNYGVELGILATAAVATTPMVKDYMASDYALKPWGSWAYALEQSGIYLDGNGSIDYGESHCYQNTDCYPSNAFVDIHGNKIQDFDAGLFKTNTKLVCPTTSVTDDNGKSTLYDCVHSISTVWKSTYQNYKYEAYEDGCNAWYKDGTEDRYKSCTRRSYITFWGMSSNSLHLTGETWINRCTGTSSGGGECNLTDEKVNVQSINEVEVLFAENVTGKEALEDAVEDLLDKESLDGELPIYLIADSDLGQCGENGCVDVPPQHFVDNTVVIPVDDNDIPVPPAIGLPPVSLPSDRPLPPISDPIYGDAIDSVISGTPTGDPDTDKIADDIIKPIIDGEKPIVDTDSPVDPPIDPPIDPPVEGSVVSVSNLTGIESRLDTTNQLLENMNVNVDLDMTGVEERIDTTNELIGGLSTTTVPISTVPDSSKASSFWTSNYPNGFQGVWNNFNNDFQNTPLVGWVDSFKLSYVSEGIPTWSMCFDLGFVDFGCQPIEIDSRVWLAIRAFILFTAALLARRLVFGG